MRAAILVTLLGVGTGALGLVVADLYVAGALILALGVIGVAVAAGDRLRRYAATRWSPS
jgi:hypothetical protein